MVQISPSTMFVVKCIKDGEEHVGSISVDGSKEVTAGSSKRCDLQITCSIVSKQHLAFRVFNDGIMLAKNQGRNSTYVGERLMYENRWISLEDGDIIRFGSKRSKPNIPRTELRIIKDNVQEAENVTVPNIISTNGTSYFCESENRSALSEINKIEEKSNTIENENTSDKDKIIISKVSSEKNLPKAKKNDKLNSEKSNVANSSVNRREVTYSSNLRLQGDNLSSKKSSTASPSVGSSNMHAMKVKKSGLNAKGDNLTCENDNSVSFSVECMKAATNSKNDNTSCDKSDFVSATKNEEKSYVFHTSVQRKKGRKGKKVWNFNAKKDNFACEKSASITGFKHSEEAGTSNGDNLTCGMSDITNALVSLTNVTAKNNNENSSIVVNPSSSRIKSSNSRNLEMNKDAECKNVEQNFTKGNEASLPDGEASSRSRVNDVSFEDCNELPDTDGRFSDDDEEGAIYSQQAEVTYFSSDDDIEDENIGLETMFNKSFQNLPCIKIENEGDVSFSQDISRDTLNPLSDDNDCNDVSINVRNRRSLNDNDYFIFEDVICLSDSDDSNMEAVNKNEVKDLVDLVPESDSDHSFGKLVIVDVHSMQSTADENAKTGVVQDAVGSSMIAGKGRSKSSLEMTRGETSKSSIVKKAERMVPSTNDKKRDEDTSVKSSKRTKSDTVDGRTTEKPLRSDNHRKQNNEPIRKKFKVSYVESSEENSDLETNEPLDHGINVKQSIKNTIIAHTPSVKSSKSKDMLRKRKFSGNANVNKKRKTASQEALLEKRKEKLKEITVVKGNVKRKEIAAEKILKDVETSLVKNKVLPKVKVTDNNRGTFLTECTNTAWSTTGQLKKDSKATSPVPLGRSSSIFDPEVNKNEGKQIVPSKSNLHQNNKKKSISTNPDTPSTFDVTELKSILKKIKPKPSMYKEFSDQPLAIHPINRCHGKRIKFDENIKINEVERKEGIYLWPSRHYSKAVEMIDVFVHSKLLTVDHIGYWQASWLMWHKKNNMAPPHVCVNAVRRDDGSSLNCGEEREYDKMMKHILYNELWHDLFNQWQAEDEISFQTQSMSEKPSHHIVIVQGFKPAFSKKSARKVPGKTKKIGIADSYKNRLISVQTYKVTEEQEEGVKDQLSAGQVTIVNLNVTKHDGSASRTIVFAYIFDVCKLRVNKNDKAMVKEYGLDRYYEPKYVYVVSFYYSARSFEVIIGSAVKMMILTTIDNHIREFQAFSLSKSCALRNALVLPGRYDFSFNNNFKPVIEGKPLTSTQYNAISGCVSMCYSDKPNVSIIEGIPGSGKTQVIIDIILELLLNGNCEYPCETKILLCVGCDYAIDDIISRLTKEERSRKSSKKINLTAYSSTLRNPKNYRYFLWNKADKAMKNLEIQEEFEKDKNLTLAQINRYKSSCSTTITAKPHITRVDKLSLEKYTRTLAALRTIEKGSPKMTEYVNSKLRYSVEWDVLQNSDLIITDMRSCWSEIFENFLVPSEANGGSQLRFTTCIIDDANQCSEIYAMIPTMVDIRHLILVGDDKQLSPNLYSQAVKSVKYDQSILARLLKSNERNHSKIPVYRLNDQIRINKEIFLWNHTTFYSHFHDVIYESSKRHVPSIFRDIKPYLLINHNYELEITENNDDEALLIMRLVSIILKRDARVRIGILVPFRGQLQQLKSVMNEMMEENELPKNNKILVKFVGQSLGREYDIVFASLTEAKPNPDLTDKWINVAFTRAMNSLIVCGNFNGLKDDKMLGSLYDNGRERNMVCDLNTPAKDLTEEQLKSVIFPS